MLSLVTIEKENVKEKLYELFYFDNDIIGETGEKFVDNKAKELGLNSTLDLFIYEAESQTSDYKELARMVVDKFTKYPETKEFYKEVTAKFENVADKMVVALSAL
ncbi:hypothetical protein AAGG74_17860 [Bacillus mexicanus]|uniref:hypothetical protein n=1 Tax=Bacillus mexicanus TaxID=2834415 RepID=UPI003D2130BD